MEAAGRLLHRDWDLYDTRHAVFRPARMTPRQLEEGYWRAYRDFYRWGGILRGAATKPDLAGALRHAAYAVGWKKCEPVWDALIRARRVARALPLLERVLAGKAPARAARSPALCRSEPRPPAEGARRTCYRPVRPGEVNRHEGIPQALHHQGLVPGGDRSRPRSRAERPPPQAKATAPSDRVRFGVIGCKGMGWADMRSALKTKGVECVALADVDQSVLDERAKDALHGERQDAPALPRLPEAPRRQGDRRRHRRHARPLALPDPDRRARGGQARLRREARGQLDRGGAGHARRRAQVRAASCRWASGSAAARSTSRP